MADPEVGAPGNSDVPLSPTPVRATFSLEDPHRLTTTFAHHAASLAQESGIHPRILAFVNTETQLSLQGPKQEVVVDSNLAALFGVEWSSAQKTYVPISSSSPFRSTQIFSTATFNDLRSQLWNRARGGVTALAGQSNVQVLANPHYGVPAYTTNLLWSYLNPVTYWWSHLTEWVKGPADLEPWNYEMFPNYYTVEQLNPNNHQVNLLANPTSWNVASDVAIRGLSSNSYAFRSFLT